jgi:hypothetical protein
MTDPAVTAIVKFLVQLKAENLALLKHLEKEGSVPHNLLHSEIAMQRQKLESLPGVAHLLLMHDPNNLESVLDTLSTVRPG